MSEIKAGVPKDIASKGGMPKPSYKDGWTNKSAFLRQDKSSLSDKNPVKLMESFGADSIRDEISVSFVLKFSALPTMKSFLLNPFCFAFVKAVIKVFKPLCFFIFPTNKI